MDIPYFGHGMQITYFVKNLLRCVHGGYLWLDPKVSIDDDLIHHFTGLPMEGDDPTSLFGDKHGDREVVLQVVVQYNTTRGVQGLRVDWINDPFVRFGAQFISSKLLCNNIPNEVSAGCIHAATKCAMGVTMSWAHFLVEEFRVDCLEA